MAFTRAKKSAQSGGGGRSRFFHAMDSERAVLGGVMMLGEARNEYYDNVINSRFALSASHFVSEGHKSIWRAIDYCNANNPAGNWDVREVYQEMLKKRMIAREGEKPTAGQIPDDYLADLTQIAGAAVNMMPYAKLIVEAWEWRVTGDAFSRAAGLFKPSGDSWDESASVTEVSDKAHAMLLRADEKIRRGYVDDVRSGGELAKEMFDEVTEAINNDGINKKFRGLYTSIWQLDNETSGLMPGEMTVLGARPNVGKTALGLW
ncbi:MAG: DnaB-like helicase N-terminal domain-containing protein, partial [Pseudohongiellaceae bacterium]